MWVNFSSITALLDPCISERKSGKQMFSDTSSQCWVPGDSHVSRDAAKDNFTNEAQKKKKEKKKGWATGERYNPTAY